MAIVAIFEILVPIFALIVIGWLAVALRLLPQEAGDALSGYVFSIAVPVLLFRALGTLELPAFEVWSYWATYFVGVAVTWTASALVVRRLFGRDARAGVIAGLSGAFSNLVLLGVPVFQGAFGEEGLLIGLVLVSVHLPVMMVAASVLIEFAERADGIRRDAPSILGVAGRVGRNLARNPLIIGILAGLAFRASGLELPALATDVIGKIAGTAIPVALIALGMGLYRYGIAGNVLPAAVLAGLKLFLLPGVVLLVGTKLFGLPPLVAAVATLAAAMPTGVNPYLIAVRFGTGHALASNTITIASFAAAASVAFWLWVLGA